MHKGAGDRMNYVVIDLEWNQSPLGRGTEKKNLPFEIIEIGAVKLDDERKIIDEFHAIIKPQVYKELHFKTQEIIHMKMVDLKEGTSFKNAIDNFFQWCGENYRFCTWGQMDLTELQRNMSYFNIIGYIDKPIAYYDVQKLFSLDFEGIKNPRTLEYAVDFLNFEKEENFHRALFDAEYTAKVFKVLDIKIIEKYYSIDYYHNPKNKEEEIYLTYDDYAKYISMEYNTKEEVMEDKDVKETVCYLCGKKSAKKIKWFSNNAKIYYCLAYCKDHGFLKGKIRIKKSSVDRVFAVKTVKLINREVAEGIKLKQEEVRIRKQQKRSKKKSHQNI